MIEGKLVNLRAPEMADLERDTAWANDPAVTRFHGLRYQQSQIGEESWLRGHCERPQSYSGALFAIETKNGRHIGNIELHGGSAEDRRATLGVMIGERACWSQGYGTDAVRTLLRFAFDEMNLNKISLKTFDFNQRAQGLLPEVRFRAGGPAARRALQRGFVPR